MCSNTVEIATNLVAVSTRFGEIILGKLVAERAEQRNHNNLVQVCNGFAELTRAVEKFWAFEDINLCSKKDPEQELCEMIFKEQHKLDMDGRFIVTIPLKPNIKSLGSSRHIALKRFLILEKKFQRNEIYRQKYIEFMREFEQLGHMSQVPYNQEPASGMVFHIPHHGVHESSEKFRVVFDASCKTDANISLNDAQMVGERLQKDLHVIILRFRRHPIAICADIAKMYRQVKISESQYDLQRIFWRETSDEPIKEFCITRVIYGMASAAHCSVRAMIEGASRFKQQYPNAVRAICDDFYVDDGITGASSVEEAIVLARDMKKVLEQSGFHLRKWKSNSEKLVQEMEGENDDSHTLCENSSTSVLGLKWLIKSDEFTYEVKNANTDCVLTKRIVLGKIAQLYDPNGFVSPFITSAKIFMQSLWKSDLNWDTQLPEHLVKDWRALWANIESLENIRIPRFFGFINRNEIQLHGFSDASARAYGAVIYVRHTDCNGVVRIRIIAAKSKIVPIKPVSIPRSTPAAPFTRLP